MKILKYRLFEDGPEVAMTWSETNEAIAGREACNGEYTIEEDGQPEPAAEPTTDEVINALLGVTV